MSDTVRVYVNEKGVTVPASSVALDAVRLFSPESAVEIQNGAARLLDSRGLPIEADTNVHGGAIYRIVPVRNREAESES